MAGKREATVTSSQDGGGSQSTSGAGSAHHDPPGVHPQCISRLDDPFEGSNGVVVSGGVRVLGGQAVLDRHGYASEGGGPLLQAGGIHGRRTDQEPATMEPQHTGTVASFGRGESLDDQWRIVAYEVLAGLHTGRRRRGLEELAQHGADGTDVDVRPAEAHVEVGQEGELGVEGGSGHGRSPLNDSGCRMPGVTWAGGPDGGRAGDRHAGWWGWRRAAFLLLPAMIRLGPRPRIR